MGRYIVQTQFTAARRGQLYRALDATRGSIVVLRTWSSRHGETRVPEHPRAARVIEAGRAGGKYYLVTEDLGERTLEGALGTDARAALVAILDAVSGAHRQGVLHRHLAPHNIHLHPARGCVVADYGVPWMGTDGAFHERILPFVAPEARTSPWAASALSEAWSAGAIGWYLLAGEAPPPDPRSAALAGPEDLVGVIRSLLEPDPRRRIPCLRALDALRENVARIEA